MYGRINTKAELKICLWKDIWRRNGRNKVIGRNDQGQTLLEGDDSVRLENRWAGWLRGD